MELIEFSGKVEEAACILRLICSTGNPSEEQVKRATKLVGLPVTFESDSFVVDPVRGAIFIKAYEVPMRAGVTMEKVIENAWLWHETSRLAVV